MSRLRMCSMTLWVAITHDRDGGCRVQLRTRRAGNIADMQSAKQRGMSQALRHAERLFGPLAWISGEQAGLPSYIAQIAEITVAGIE